MNSIPIVLVPCLHVRELMACVFALCLTMPVQADSRPDILVLVADDHRYDFLGCAGHPVVQTPQLDRLAADGVRFRNAFVTTSNGAASRATIFTGLVERSHGFTFLTAPIRSSLLPKSYPAMLKEAGYRTGLVGKFGVHISGTAGRVWFDDFELLSRNPYRKRIGQVRRHVTDMIGDRSIEIIQATQPNQPLCLSVSFNAPHAEDSDKKDPYPPPETEMTLYRNVAVDQPRWTETIEHQPDFIRRSINRDRWHWRWDTPEKYERNVRNYYRLLTAMDRNVGRIVRAFKGSRRDRPFVVIFLGDNGYYKGDRGFAGKWTHYEESLRIPLIVYDSRIASTENHRVADQIALNLDILPTILDASGLEPLPSHQGQSLLPCLKDLNANWPREQFFCEHLMNAPSIPKWEGIRTQRFTYARYFLQNPVFEYLHDRQVDSDQLKNLARDAQYADVLKRLRRKTDEAIERYSASPPPAN